MHFQTAPSLRDGLLTYKDKHRKLDSTCWGLLTEKLLHLLHTHVNVEARDLVVIVVVAVDA